MDRAAANAGVAVAVATARASCIPRLRNPMACPQSPYVHCCTDPTRSACTRFIRDRRYGTYFPLCPWVPIVRVCVHVFVPQHLSSCNNTLRRRELDTTLLSVFKRR